MSCSQIGVNVSHCGNFGDYSKQACALRKVCGLSSHVPVALSYTLGNLVLRKSRVVARQSMDKRISTLDPNVSQRQWLTAPPTIVAG